MTPDQIQQYGDALYDALIARKAITPLTDRAPGISIEDAYRIQQRMIERRLAKGETVIGKKIGVTSKAVQEMLKVFQPDFGLLFVDLDKDSQLQRVETEEAGIYRGLIKERSHPSS